MAVCFKQGIFMLAGDYHFTFTTTFASDDFFETSTPRDEAVRLLDSRYWETRMSPIAPELVDQVFSCVSTFDLDEDNG